MTDYKNLVKFLRGLSPWVFPDASNKRMRDAADAIEALNHLVDLNTERCEGLRKQLRAAQENYEKHLNELEAQLTSATATIEELKDEPWVESVQVDKLRQRIDELEETACHCNVRENAELIAKILYDDVDGKVFEVPKRGEIVRCGECKWWDKKDDSPYGYCYACKHGYYSEHWEIGIYRLYKADWFCADGEREVQE